MQIFSGVNAVFLPLSNPDSKVMRSFISRGSTRHYYCNKEMTGLIAPSWQCVLDHFRPFLGLLPYFKKRIQIVSEYWIKFGVVAGKMQDPQEFYLDPGDKSGIGLATEQQYVNTPDPTKVVIMLVGD